MGVAEQLGLGSTSSGWLRDAAARWPDWVARHEVLAAVEDVRGLREWSRQARPAEVDDVLVALAEIAAVDGGDDVAAAAVLAWVLLPGACTVAHRLRWVSPRIDELVAAQLWIQVRTFPWRRLRKVAANILMNTRAGVLREGGVASQTGRVDRTWARTSTVDPAELGSIYPDTPSNRVDDAATELLEVLEWACAHDVITIQDRELLLGLVEAAGGAGTRRTGRGHGGFMANDVSARVARAWGIAPVTVRRRARRSMAALAAACTGTGELWSA